MGETAMQRRPRKDFLHYLVVDDIHGWNVSVPHRITPFGLSEYGVARAKFKSEFVNTIEFVCTADLKVSRRQQIDPKPLTIPEINPKLSFIPAERSVAAQPEGGLFANWDRWDWVVALGLVLLAIGILIPLFSVGREMAAVIPLGGAMVGLGAFRTRQENDMPA